MRHSFVFTGKRKSAENKKCEIMEARTDCPRILVIRVAIKQV